MDPKTKSLLHLADLHTQGAVQASFDPYHLAFSVTAYPPSMTQVVSAEMLDHAKDSPSVVVAIANQIGNSVAEVIKKQVYAAMHTDASTAMKNSYEEKAAAMSNPNMLWIPDSAKSKKYSTIWDGIVFHVAPPEPKSTFLKDLIKVFWDTEVKKQSSFGNHPTGPSDHYVGPQAVGTMVDSTWTPKKSKGGAVLDTIRALIPGFDNMRATCPVTTCSNHGYKGPIGEVIIHLNDEHQWTREAIADWLETLDLDLTFKTPEEVKEAAKEDAKKHEMLKEMIGQPLLAPEDLAELLYGEEVKNDDHSE